MVNDYLLDWVVYLLLRTHNVDEEVNFVVFSELHFCLNLNNCITSAEFIPQRNMDR